MSLLSHDILVLEDDMTLGQLLCDMIRIYRIGQPQLSLSEVDSCQMLEGQSFDLCLFAIKLRGKACDDAVAAANARGIPVLLMSDGEDRDALSVYPDHGLLVQKPASEQDIRMAVSQLLQREPARQA